MSIWWNNANRILSTCLATINGRFAVALWNQYCQMICREFSVSLFRPHGPVLYLLPRRLKEEEPWLEEMEDSYRFLKSWLCRSPSRKKDHQAEPAAAAKSLQSCPTLCDPIDGSPPGPSIPGILQARTLEWVAISFSSAWKWKVKVKLHSCVWLLAIPWTAAYQAPVSMGVSSQEYWSGLPVPSPRQLSSWF